MIIRERKGLRWAVNAWFLAVGCVALILCIRLGHFAPTWTLGEWLINYEGGFVRRGLPGECLLLLHRWTHVPLIVLAVATWIALQAVVLIAWRTLILEASSRVWVFALMISPATLVFSLLDYTVGFRKEILFLAGLSAFIALLRSGRLQDTGAGVFMGLVLLVTTLSHEPEVCFAPYFFAALVACGRSPRRAARICAIPFLITMLAAGAAVIHKGNAKVVTDICASLGEKRDSTPGGICQGGGAIPFLEISTGSAIAGTLETIRQRHYVLVYGSLAALASIPVLLGSWDLRDTTMSKRLATCWALAGLSFLGSLVLFLVGIDWGRWIRIHVMCMATLLFVLSGVADRELEAGTVGSFPAMRRIAAVCFLFVYAVSWSLPGVYGWSTQHGYTRLEYELKTAFVRHAPRL